MEITTFYPLITAILSVQPDRPQLFRYEALTLNCTVSGNFGSWTVKRNSSNDALKSCETDFGRSSGSSCFINSVYTSDTGVYWCEAESGERSNVLHITVTADGVILETPALPVIEGDKVTLRCSQKNRYAPSSVSNFNATFFKDGVFIGNEPGGARIIPSVSKSDEGSYKCQHPSGVESPLSLLTVTARDHKTLALSTTSSSSFKIICYLLLIFLYTIIIIVCIYGYLRWSRARKAANKLAAGYPMPE